jgi:hypothetical protein
MRAREMRGLLGGMTSIIAGNSDNCAVNVAEKAMHSPRCRNIVGSTPEPGRSHAFYSLVRANNRPADGAERMVPLGAVLRADPQGSVG